MPDSRFFDTLEPITTEGLAERIGGTLLRGAGVMIHAVAPLGAADTTAVAFLSDRKFAKALSETRAGCVIVPAAAVDLAPAGAAVIVSSEPQAAWARASALLHRPVMLDRAVTFAETTGSRDNWLACRRA